MIDEYGEKSLQEKRKLKMLEEEAKSTKEKLELELLDQNINIKLIRKELEDAKILIHEKEKELSKWRNVDKHNYANDNDSIKKKLNDYIVLLDVHQKCTEKIRALEARVNLNEEPPTIIQTKSIHLKDSNEAIDEYRSQSSNDILSISEKEFNSSSNRIKVNLKIPEFHGNEEDNVTNWLYNIESIFSVSIIREDHEKLTYAKTYRRKIAIKNYKAFEICKRFNVTWQDFKDHMSNKYRPLHHEETIRLKLREMKMDKSESIRSYVNKFQQCIFEIDNMAEKDKIFYFTSGLQDRTKAHVQIQSPKTLDEAIEIAEKYETFVFNNGNNNKNVFSSNTKKIFMHKKARHPFRGKPQRNGYSKQQKSRYVSYDKSKKHDQKNIYTKQTESSKDITCYLCNEKGHIKSQCPKNKNKELNVQTRRVSNFSLHVGNSNLKLLRYWAKINGERVGVVFDTAAECSLVSKDCATKLNLEIFNSNTKIDDSNGGSSTVIGTVGMQTIDLEGTKATIELTVTNIKNVDILLGLVWFAETNVIIVLANRQIIIPSKKI